MLTRTIVFLTALAALLAVPLASAHVESFSQSKTVVAGPYTVFLAPRPDVVFANSTFTMTALVSSTDTGAIMRNVEATLLVAGPEAFEKRTQMRPDREGYLFGTLLLPARGTYSARVLLTDENGTYNADTEFEAYPNLPVRIRSADAEQDVYVGKRASLVFETVNRTSMLPVDAVQDLKIRLEHWNTEHTQMLGEEEVAAKADGAGRWKLEHTFGSEGMYHMKFASQSGGFTYADVPILHLYATNDPNPDAERALPAPGLLPLAAAGLGVALALRRR